MEEVWKDIKGYEGYYQISNFGRVKSLDRIIFYKNGSHRLWKERLLSLKPSVSHGYVTVSLRKNGKGTMFSVHRLVAEHFLECIEGKDVVNHIDEKRANNIFTNLEWVTHAENLAHNGAYQKGREKMKKVIFQYSLDGDYIRSFTYAGATEALGFNPNAVTQACLGYKRSHRGYVWRYQ